MMYPEAFAEDKDVLNAYQNEYGNYFLEEPIQRGLQTVCCIKENSQYCPKCGCYHKTNSAKRCVCLTLTSLMACLCLVVLTLSLTFHVEDMQSGYETVHHFLVLVTKTKSNDTIESKEASNPIETPTTTSAEIESPTTTESPFPNSLDEATELVEDYIDDSRENYETDSYNERKKRSVLSGNVPKNEDSIIEDINKCASFLSPYFRDYTKSGLKNKESNVEEDDDYLKRYTYCRSLIKDVSRENVSEDVSDSESNKPPETLRDVTEDRPTHVLNSPLKSEENPLKVQNSDEQDDKLSQKRSYNFDYTPMAHYPYYESGFSSPDLQHPDVVPISRASDQNIPYITSSKRTRPYPPTGPDGTNYGQSVKTSQQLTVANNQIWKPVCFRAQNAPNPSSLVCIPMTSRQFGQFDPSQQLYNHYTNPDSNQDCVNGNCDRQKGFDPPLPTVITPSTNPSDNRQQIFIPPTNSPDIHLPTAISSPNPYYFPTLNGAPIMTPHDSRQFSPNLGPAWPHRGPPGFSQSQAPHFFGPPRFPGGFGGYQQFPQPQLHMLPPQTPVDLQNPVICMYVPSRSHQFPVVDGVTEVKNRNNGNFENAKQYQPATNNSSHQTFRAGNKDCGDGEFSCQKTDACIPLERWCDGKVDCLDMSDEAECSCKHRLDKRRLCDGYFDCPAGEDELGCFGCDRDSFSCQDWERGREQSTCVPLSKMCDNVVDCINHRDELECTLLSDSIVPHKTHFVSYTRGILHRNWKGRWYPACTGPKVTEWAIQACLADAGPLSGDPRIEMTPTEYPGPYIIPNGLEIYTLSQMCRDQKVVTYVTCPPVQCGTRVTKNMLDSSVRIRETQLQNFDTMKAQPQNFDTMQAQLQNFDTMQMRSAINEPGLVALVSSIIDGGKDFVKKEHSEDSFRNNKDHFEDKRSKAQPQEKGHLEAGQEGSEWTGLIANKAKDYKTEFEPEEEEYQRWTRDADDILGVVGGRRSRPHSWPWLIALYRDGRFHCGGVIINEHWVMTAAHCMERFTKHYFEVQAGMLRRFSFSPQEQTRKVSHVILHNLYNIYDMQNDLALLRLHSKLKFNRWVRPICLPQEHISQFGPPPGSLCTAVGWGATREGGADPDDLYEVNVPILPYCKHRADQEGAGLCAGYLHGGHDACQGDSGGPLICKMLGEEERWYVAGVVSHGDGCARPDEPGVYTRVFLFIDWIKSIVNQQGDDSFPADLIPRQECPGQQCNDRRCISLFALCNSKVDCLNAEDETFCNENYLQKSPLPKLPENAPTPDTNTRLVDSDDDTGETDNVMTEANSTPLSQDSYEILRQPNEHSTYKNDEDCPENEDEEGRPVSRNSNSEVLESKTTSTISDEDEIQKLPVKQNKKLQMPLHEGEEYTTEGDVFGKAKGKGRSGESHITIHEITNQSEDYFRSLNLEHFGDDKTITEEPAYENSNTKMTESSMPIDEKTSLMPITKDSKEQLLPIEEYEFATENVHEITGKNDKNDESTEKSTYGNTFTYLQDSKSTTELENEENWSSTKAYGSVKETEDDEITSTPDSVKWNSAPSTLENGGTTHTLPPLEHQEITTLNSYYKEDTTLINELVFQGKNSSETEDVNEINYITIPPYLVPIMFPNKTSNSIEGKGIQDKSESTNHNAFENSSTLDKNKKEQEHVSGVNGNQIPNKNEEEATTITTFSPLENGSETTTLITMPPTHPDSDHKKSMDGMEKEIESKDIKNNSNSSGGIQTTNIKTEDTESFCKNFMKPNESKSAAEEPKKAKGAKSNSSDKNGKVDIHEDSSNPSVEKTDISNITSKDVLKEKREGRFVCKRYKQALLRKRRCDGIIDCEDGTDEMRCSCRERLMHLDPSLNCDGKIHCYDQTDEKHCTNNCNKTAYFCPRSKICIPQTHRCDGIRHCPEKDDEENCYALISDGGIKLDRAMVPEFRAEGIVAINSASGWRPLCVNIKYGHSAAKRGCNALGFWGYERFQEEMVRNETIVKPHGTKVNTQSSVCSGIRVKCSSEKADKFWIGQLLVEGKPMASVALVHPQWLLTHPSICRQLHIRVKCSSEKADKFWIGQLLVEGKPMASVALVHPQWLLTHPSICRQLYLESQYAEISMGRNKISDFGIRGVYEESRRINDAMSFEKSSFCLIHIDTPFHFNRKIRPIKFQLPKETSSTLDFHAVTISGRGFQKLKLNQSRLSRRDEELCFTIEHRPVECYTFGGLSENGFIITTMLHNSYVASIFDSFQVFCSAMTDVCFKKLSTFSPDIYDILLDNQSVTPKASPACDGIRCGKCVRWANVSDGELDCSDRSDETHKAFTKRQQACQRDPTVCGCRTDQFQCPSGSCIDKSSYCDGTSHCEDGSDEPPGCEHSCLKFLRFAYPHKICDGVRNCFDKSDEKWEVCHNKTCSLEGAFVCRSSGKCVPREFVCDNEADCPEGDDEENCVSILRYKLTEGTLSQQQFGVWSPKCLQNTSSDFTDFCSAMGMNEAETHEVLSPNRTIVAVDGFSKVTLNNATTIVIRKGRPLVEVDSTSPCKYLYIKCL